MSSFTDLVIMRIAKKKIIVTEDKTVGFTKLHQFLTKIDEFLKSGKADAESLRLARDMNNTLADDILLAYSDWDLFCKLWSVTIFYNDEIESSNVYCVTFESKTLEKRYLRYVFKNLKKL